MNEAFWRSPDGPVFLYIGGEGPIFEFDVLAGTAECMCMSSVVCTHCHTPENSLINKKSDTLSDLEESGNC